MIITRLQRERDDLMAGWQRIGVDAGRAWVLTEGYYEIESYIEAVPDLLRIDKPWPNEDVLMDYGDDFSENPDWTETSAIGFWRGFARGAVDTWDKIRKQMTDIKTDNS